MKLKQLVTGGALAATVLTIGSAQAEENPYEGIVFCKAQITKINGEDEDDISVTLPFTTTGSDGQEYTHWNLGKVPAGGVADSWHSKGGPGKFVTHNDGNVGAYIYLTSHAENYLGNVWHDGGQYGPSSSSGWKPSPVEQDFEIAFETIFGGGADRYWAAPTHSLQHWQHDGRLYCLAFTRDINAKLPTWHMLNRCYWSRRDEQSGYTYSAWDESEDVCNPYIGAYMGYLRAGEYMPFDVKFWAPRMNSEVTMGFTFRVEAASFPLWEHDRDVQ